METYLAKGVTLHQAYSCTEACSSTAFPRGDVAVAKPHVAGWPMMHTEIRLIDGSGEDVAAGDVGEIAVRGPQVMRGYWENPEATAEALRDGWLHTGDLGRFDDQGNLAVVDRKNDMIISGGLNVYPAEIENAISGLAGVVEVGAFGVPHDRWGETVAVVVVGEVEPDELIRHCDENLGDYKVPRFVTVTDQPLPRSMSGKIMRRELREAFDESAALENRRDLTKIRRLMREIANEVLLDDSGEEVLVGSVWEERPTAVVFLRHFGCTFCREHSRRHPGAPFGAPGGRRRRRRDRDGDPGSRRGVQADERDRVPAAGRPGQLRCTRPPGSIGAGIG